MFDLIALGAAAVLGAAGGGEFALAFEEFGDLDFVAVEEAGGDEGDDVVPGVLGGPGDAAADLVALVAGEGGEGLGGVAVVVGEVAIEIVPDADGQGNGGGEEEEAGGLATAGAAPSPAPEAVRDAGIGGGRARGVRFVEYDGVVLVVGVGGGEPGSGDVGVPLGDAVDHLLEVFGDGEGEVVPPCALLHVPPAPSFGVAVGDLQRDLQGLAQILDPPRHVADLDVADLDDYPIDLLPGQRVVKRLRGGGDVPPPLRALYTVVPNRTNFLALAKSIARIMLITGLRA